jgi:hypothetical protein
VEFPRDEASPLQLRLLLNTEVVRRPPQPVTVPETVLMEEDPVAG